MIRNFTILNNNLKLNIITHDVENPNAVLIHIHGLGGHFQSTYNKYDSFSYRIKMLPPDVISYGLELRGHGLSDGARFAVNDFNDYLYDLHTLVEYITQYHPQLQIFILGCSMGGAIATLYSIKYPKKISGLILLAPMTGISEKINQSWLKIKLVVYISYILPSCRMISISNDDAYIEEYMMCRKMCKYHNKLNIRCDTGRECYNAMLSIEENSNLLNTPILAFHAKNDTVTSSKTTIEFINRCSSYDKKIVELDTGYHNLLVPISEYDMQPDEILNTINKWIDNKIIRIHRIPKELFELISID